MFENVEKNILDLVTFDDIKISYPMDKDVQVVFTIDPAVRASTRDWVGIYPVGWTAFESCLTYLWGIGRHFEGSSRTRYMIFKARDLRKAKCGSHYQFVYVSKYLDVLGVSQYFQFCPSEATPNFSTVSVRFKDQTSPVNDPSCKLAAELSNSKVFTTCGKCQDLFALRETSFTLADKVDHLEKTVATLSSQIGVSTWDEDSERSRFKKFLADIYQPKPDGSGETTKTSNAVLGLVSAMDEVISKAAKVKADLLKMMPCDVLCLIDPNASGILPIPEDKSPEEPAKLESGEPASGEPSMIQPRDTSKPQE